MTGTFPSILKQARVIPMFKSGHKEDPGNYRPISILPTLSKIIEKHVAKQCLVYLEQFNLLHLYIESNQAFVNIILVIQP